MTVREIQAFLVERYAVEVSPDFISTVTDAVHTDVTAWQSRLLEPMYPVVFFDALASRSATKRFGGSGRSSKPAATSPTTTPRPCCSGSPCRWKSATYWHLAMNQFAILYEDRFVVPRT